MGDLPHGSRRECKYLVPDSLVPQLRSALMPFLVPDPYARNRPGTQYPVSTLYLDSPTLELYASTVRGLRNRFKLRLRRYAVGPDAPVHAEIKRRSDDTVIKSRERISARSAAAFLGGRSLDESHGPAFSEFRRLASSLHARPVIHVRYLREAWLSNAGDPVRVTFDTRLEMAADTAGTPRQPSDWRPIDVAGTVLEIKFNQSLPAWLAGLIREFDLQRRSVAKYVLAVGQYPDRQQLAMTMNIARSAAAGRA